MGLVSHKRRLQHWRKGEGVRVCVCECVCVCEDEGVCVCVCVCTVTMSILFVSCTPDYQPSLHKSLSRITLTYKDLQNT